MNTIWILLSIMYLSRVLTKFLIVGRAQHTKNQNHEYYLDCVIIFRAISTIWIVLELQTRAMSSPLGVCNPTTDNVFPLAMSDYSFMPIIIALHCL